MNTLLGYLSSYGFILAVFLLSFLCQKLHLVQEEGTRKLIHILVCITWIIMEKFFSGSIHTVIIPLTFIAVNYISMKKHLIPGMDREKNDSYGTVFYAVSLTLMNLIAFFNADFTVPAGTALFALSFGDGLAAICGRIPSPLNIRLREGKTLFGTLACLTFSFLGILLVSFLMGMGLPVWGVLVLALTASLLEFIGGKLDNLVIPLGVFLCCYLLLG